VGYYSSIAWLYYNVVGVVVVLATGSFISFFSQSRSV